MQLRSSTLLTLAFGAAIIVAPSLTNIGSDSVYDSAFAAKGGNGKGNGGGNGGGNGKGGGGKSATAKGVGQATGDTGGATIAAVGKQKISAKQHLEKGPDHPSSLGKWNATKDFYHPSIQAHIRNGNFEGTIGMLAHFGLAMNTYGDLQAQAAAAAQASADLAAALMAAGYGGTDPALFDATAALAEYQGAAALDPTLNDQTINDLIAASQNVPTAAEMDAALADLAGAEAEMAAASNRAPWEEVRSVVIERMGLTDPMLAAPVEPAPVPEPTPTP